MKKYILLIATTLLVGACASTPAPDNDHYVVVRPEQTQLIGAANDEGNVILSFQNEVSDDVEFFDHQGKRLKNIRKGKLVCVAGLHRGILLRHGDAMSYVSVRPGARLQDGPAMVVSPQLLALRKQVTVHAPAEQAMKLAMAAVRNQEDGPSLTDNPVKATTAASEKGSNDDPQRLVLTNWRNAPGIDLPPSQMITDGANAYIVFLPGGLMPIKAAPVIDKLSTKIKNANGVLLISGITPEDAPEPVVELAHQRAALIREILISEGVDPDKLTVSAVFRSGTHARKTPGRPDETVGLRWLGDS